MLRLLYPVQLILLSLLAACGGGSANPAPTPDFRALARDAAQDAVLVLGDMPQFWTVAEGEGPVSRVELEQDCDIFDSAVIFPAAAAVERGEGFQGGDERRARSAVAVFETEELASGALDTVDETAERCRPELLAAIDEAARKEAASRGFDLGILADVDAEIKGRDPGRPGDETLAYRAHVEIGVIGINAEYTLDVVLVREGRVVGALLYSNFGDLDEAEELELTETLAQKLAAAEASLP